jgi:hypothetical protein
MQSYEIIETHEEFTQVVSAMKRLAETVKVDMRVIGLRAQKEGAIRIEDDKLIVIDPTHRPADLQKYNRFVSLNRFHLQITYTCDEVNNLNQLSLCNQQGEEIPSEVFVYVVQSFFDDLSGVQVAGNMPPWIRSVKEERK